MNTIYTLRMDSPSGYFDLKTGTLKDIARYLEANFENMFAWSYKKLTMRPYEDDDMFSKRRGKAKDFYEHNLSKLKFIESDFDYLSQILDAFNELDDYDPNWYFVTERPASKSYKEYEKHYIGGSDIAALTLRFPDTGLVDLKFGMDDDYSAYIVDEYSGIGDHYVLVAEGTHWLKIFDDVERTKVFHADRIRVYRAGEMGCIIQLINEKEKTNI